MNCRYSLTSTAYRSWLRYFTALGVVFMLFVPALLAQITIPSGNTNTGGNRKPLGAYFGYERNASIYLQSEIGATTGNVNSVGWFVNTSTSTASVPVQVYLKLTTASTFAAVSTVATELTGATLVYSGTITPAMITNGNWVTLATTTPFSYTGGSNNLEVIVLTNFGGGGGEGSTAKAIRYSNAGAARSQSWNADTNPPTGNGSLTGIATNGRPNIQLSIGAPLTCFPPAGLSVTPTNTSATVNWTAASPVPAGGYDWEVRSSGSPGTGGALAGGNTALLTAATGNVLSANQTYTLYVRSYCSVSDQSSWASTTFYTGYCNPSNALTGATYYIANFSTTAGYTNISNLGSGLSASGYGNFTAQSASQSAGGVVNFATTFQTNTCGFNIWIDWNNDLVFSTGEKVYATGAYATNPSGSFTVPALTPNGAYRMRVRMDYLAPDPSPCDAGRTSAEVEDYTFNVTDPPSCAAPVTVSNTALTTTSLSASWTASTSSVLNYEWEIRTDQNPGVALNRIETNTTAGLTLSSSVALAPNTTHYVYVRTNCTPSGTSDWSTPLTVFTGYCQPVNTTTTYYINNVSTTSGYSNISNTASGFSANGYGNFTAQSVSQSAGGAVNFLATFNGNGSGNSYGCNVWVDWNNNLSFESGEKMYASGASYVTTASGTITVPALTPNGSYRMRVRADYLSTNPDPCATSAYSEIEDYTFVVSAPPACLPPTLVTASALSSSSGTTSWTASTSAPSGGYQVYHSTSNTAPTAGTTPTYYTPSGTTQGLSLLSASTPYYVWVRSDCAGSGGESTWAGPATFTTPCNAIAAPFTENFETTTGSNSTTPPACWSNLGSGGQFWQFQTGGGTGPGYGVAASLDHTLNTSGSGRFAWIDGSNGMLANQLVTPDVDISPLTAPSVSFWMRSNNVDDAAQNPTRLDAWDGSAWITINTYTGNSSAWVRRLEILPALPSVTRFRLVVTPTATGSAFYNDILVDDFGVIEGPTCGSATALTLVSRTATSLSASWTAPALGTVTNYSWEIRTDQNPGVAGAAQIQTGTTSGTTMSNGAALLPNTQYYVFVRTNCSSGPADWSSGLAVYTGYCTPAPTSVDNSGIILVEFSTVSKTSGDVPGHYEDYSATDIGSAAAGQVVPVNITFATGYTYGTRIWVDWDNSLDFSAGEEMYFGLSTSANPTILNASITVPALQAAGSYRMRIGGTDNDAGPATACYNGAYGTFEDYTLAICSNPVLSTLTNVENCAAQTFSVRVGAAGVPTDGSATITWTVNGLAQAPVVYTANPTVLPARPVDKTIVYTLTTAQGCTSTSGPKWSTCAITVDCQAATAMEVPHCYTTNDTRTWTFTNTEVGGRVSLKFLSGTMGPNDNVIVWDGEEGVSTQLSGPTGNLTGLPVINSTPGSNTLSVSFTTDVDGSCAEGTAGLTSGINFQVRCYGCSSPEGYLDVNDPNTALPTVDCGTGTFEAFVVFEDNGFNNTTQAPALKVGYSLTVGSNAPVVVTNLDGVNDPVTFGIYSLGTFPVGTPLDLTLLHEDQSTQSACNNVVATDMTVPYSACPPLNDACGSGSLSVLTPGNCGETAGSTLGAGQDGTRPPCAAGTDPVQDVWYTVNTTGFVNITMTVTDGSASVVGAQLFSACGTPTTTPVLCSNDVTSAPVVLNNFPVGTYYLRLFTSAPGAGTFTVCITGTGAAGGACAGFTSSPNLVIPDDVGAAPCAPVTDVIAVGSQGGDVVFDMNVYVNITHTYTEDLDITLTSPLGMVVPLISGKCAGGQNMRLEFDDEATTTIAAGACPATDYFVIPQSALSAFDGQDPTGNWTITIQDMYGDFAVATLNSWCLIPTFGSNSNCDGPPNAGNSTGTASVCLGGTASYSNNAVNNSLGVTYAWYVSNSASGPWTTPASGTGQATQSLTTDPQLVAGTYYYAMVATCTATSQSVTSLPARQLVVKPVPTVAVGSTPANATICTTGSVALSASGASSYAWLPTTGLSNAAIANPVATPGTTTTYTVTGTGANGCTDTETVTVIRSTNPVIASATATPATVCQGNASSLLATVTVPAYCASTHANGCSGDNVTNVTFNNLNNNTTGCGGTSHYTYFTGGGTQTTDLSAGNSYSLQLSFGTDGNQYFGAWIDYDDDKVFGVSEFLGASANAGGGGTIGVLVAIPPGATNGVRRLRIVGGNDSPVTSAQACGASSSPWGETQDYNVTIIDGVPAVSPYTYAWAPDVNDLSATDIANPVANDVQGTQTYTVTVMNAFSCTSTRTVTVTMQAPPDAGTGGSLNVCSTTNGSVLADYLTGEPLGGSWSGPSTVTGGLYNATSMNPGNYVYTVAATPPCTVPATATVIVTEDAAPNAGISANFVVCASNAMADLLEGLDGTPDAIGGSWSPSGPVYDATTQSPGVFTYTVAAVGACVVDATAQVTVSEQGLPNAGTDGGVLTVCASSTVNENMYNALLGTPETGGSWSGPSPVTGNNYKASTMTPGVYTYTVNGTPPCAGTASATITVIEQDTPSAGTSASVTYCASSTTNNMFLALGSGVDNNGTWSPSGPNYDATTMAPGAYTYTVPAITPCSGSASATITVTEQAVPYAGTDGALLVCSNGITPVGMFTSLGGSPMAGGTWTDPSDAPHAATFNPATDAVGVYTYTVSVGAPCSSSSSATVTVGYNLVDSDSDGTIDCFDNCPNTPGQNGSTCDADDSPLVYSAGTLVNCHCQALACSENVTLELRSDGNSQQIGWEFLDSGGGVACSGGYPTAPYPTGINGSITPSCCLAPGCYRLRVIDSGGDGFAGGYQLRESGATGRRIIDDFNNFTTASSGISNLHDNGAFCVPISDVKPIFTSCDKLDWVNHNYIVCGRDQDVYNAYSTTASTTGYEFWFFDPNGAFSYRRFRSHTVSDGITVTDIKDRACHFHINRYAQDIPEGMLLNVRVRARVNGGNRPFGPACLFKLDAARAACPLVKLVDNAADANYACGSVSGAVNRVFGGSNSNANKITSVAPQFQGLPAVLPANVRYQFRFRAEGEVGSQNPWACVVRPAQTSPTLYLNWTTGQKLKCQVTYSVDVRVSRDGGQTWCIGGANSAADCDVTVSPWGKVCYVKITSGGFCPVGLAGGSSNLAEEGQPTLTMYPNPNRGDQVFISLSEVRADLTTVSVDIFDLSGKKVVTRTIPVQDGYLKTSLDLNGGLAGGMYMVNITAGDKTYTERLVIQP